MCTTKNSQFDPDQSRYSNEHLVWRGNTNRAAHMQISKQFNKSDRASRVLSKTIAVGFHPPNELSR